MTNKQRPAQFDWATELLDAQGHVTLSAKEAHEIGARLRSMGEKLKAYEDLDEAASDVQLLRMGDPLVTAAPATAAWPSEFPHEQMDAVALARYKVMPSHESMFHRFAVVAGDGSQQLYIGREVECENMARKFAGAFLDGAFAFHSMLAAAPTTQPAPQPAPQQEAQEPVAVVVPCYTPSGKRVALYSAKQDLPIGTQLYTAPQPSPAAQGDALSDDAVRVPLDNLHADAAYLIGRLREGSMPYARAIEIIRERIDAAKAAIRARAAQGDALDTMRLDWLDADESRCVFHLGKSWYTRPSYGLPYRKRASLREAIDAARKQGANHD